MAFDVGASFGALASAVLGFVLVVSFLGFIGAVVFGLFSRRWRTTLYFGVTFFLVLTALLAGRVVSVRQRAASMRAAEPIISAAERFHSVTGMYPRSIHELIPAYLPTEPRTKMGLRGTRFTLSAGPDRFCVTFALPSWMLCTYHSQSRKWVIDD